MDSMITIELVPSTAWWANVRSNVSRAEWDKIRFKAYDNAKGVCEICGEKGKNQGYSHDLECHEIWEYIIPEYIQKLTGFIALCPECHTVKHPGLANIKGRTEVVFRKLCKVNNITRAEARQYIVDAFRVWKKRSEHTWTLDISLIKI